jgi:hypothetical protein
VTEVTRGRRRREYSGLRGACPHGNQEDIMAFNGLGDQVFLAEGASAYWSYWFGGDRGTQFASADVKIPNQGAVHVAYDQCKSKDNNGNATYYVTITNRGPGGCFHNLQGGGMS